MTATRATRAAAADPLDHQAEHQGAATAVEADGLRWSWSTLRAIAGTAADRLASAGIRPGDRVAVVADDSAGFVALVHALRRLGGVLVPLSRRVTAEELSAMLVAGHPALLVSDRVNAGKASEAGDRTDPALPTIAVEELIPVSRAPDAWVAAKPPAAIDPRQPATIIFTSGSTGMQRAALLTYANHVASAEAWAAFLNPEPTDRWLACLPFNHVGGLSLIHRSALWGVPLHLAGTFEPAQIWRAIDRHAISHLSIVGSTLARLVEAAPARTPPSTLRAILVGGESTPPEAIRDAMALGLPIVVTYGATETSSGVTALAPAEWAHHPASSGRALPGIELQIVVNGRPVGDGVPGDIQVRGPVVFAGYDDGRSPVDDHGWLATADEGAIDREGFLTVLGRRDRLIISGGENVDPLEVEAVLRAHPAIADALVVGRSDERWGTVAIATIVLRPGQAVEDDALRAFCRARLAGFKVPVAFERVQRLRRSEVGKLRRRVG